MRIATLYLLVGVFSVVAVRPKAWAQEPLPTVTVRNFHERRTLNESFDRGLASWNVDRTANATILNWNQLPVEPPPFKPADDRRNTRFLTEPADSVNPLGSHVGKVLRMRGINSLWQYVPINGKSRAHVVAVNARKRLIPGQTGAMGWVGFGVTYFDANWNEVDDHYREILNTKQTYLPGSVTGTNTFSCIGTQIPINASHAILWLNSTAANTEVFIDDFILLNCFFGEPLQNLAKPMGERLTQDPLETCVVGNSNFVNSIEFDVNDVTNPMPKRSIQTFNEPFWDQESTPLRVHNNGVIWYRGLYSQKVQVYPGTYELRATHTRNEPNGPPAYTGIDFFDVNWNYLGHSDAVLDGTTPVFGSSNFKESVRRFTVPVGAVHSYVHIWYEAEPNAVRPFFTMGEYVLRPVANRP
jgi:hypothetical protein